MVGDNTHRHIHMMVFSIFFATEIGDLSDKRSEDIGVVIGSLTLKRHAEAFESHAGIDYLRRQRLKRTICLAVILHEHEIPDFDYLRMIVVHEFTAGLFGALFVGAKVDMNFRAWTAGTCIAHFPKIVVLVPVKDMVGGKMLGPYAGSLVVTGEPFVGRTLEYSGI